jgi:antitoxin VapB
VPRFINCGIWELHGSKGERDMKSGRFTEHELLDGLNSKTAHADELAELLPQELSSVWDEYFDSDERVSDDFMEDRDQPPKDLE